MPFFSIVLPVYNRAHLLGRAIASLLAQSETDWELWAIDDGSEDGSLQALESYAASDARIHALAAAHRGQAFARNEALHRARGSYVTFLDSDDEYLPEHLSLHRRWLVSHPEVDFAYGQVQAVGEAQVPDMERPGQTIDIRDCIVTGTIFLKSSVWRQIGGFPSRDFGEDYALLQEVRAQGFRVERVPFESYRYYRTEPDSLCTARLQSSLVTRDKS